ncbi:hypothetical protein BU17DRAFT_93265 [Hysterangium stoloniferum]|nr:hypothetical protein BU17DRAFT_93265 [Hysterangium stoloniferum]
MGSISRTCSIDYTANAFNSVEQRRTRKRITSSQLRHLEELYQESSHPTREQRDALARRIQMETKSVTIWFQNKRQTDRKVALHNATHSRSSVSAANGSTSSPTPNITITAPTSPSTSQESNSRFIPEDPTRKQSIPCSHPVKRTLSYASSISSSSTASSSRTRPSLDRVASRSEIRFTDKSEKPKFSQTMNTTAIPLSRSSSHSSLLPPTHPAVVSPIPSTSNRPPASPPPSSSRELWAHMLSSPVAPSSPPAADIVAYARTRKTRTLDWACAVARVSTEDDLPSLSTSAQPHHPASLASTLPRHCRADAVACQREYEEETAMTEDETELVTPQSSQDVSINWSTDLNEDEKNFSRADNPLKSLHIMGLVRSIGETPLTTSVPMDTDGWQEDEMKAALALCGLRG